jgi:hypothetical protein|nr:MAG TPA: hypothetical protein [Caudoviricetes sp.]
MLWRKNADMSQQTLRAPPTPMQRSPELRRAEKLLYC